MKAKIKMSRNDRSIISTTFDSNNISSKINTINKLINTINYVDLTLIESKVLKKQILELQKLIKKSELIADNINEKYWNYNNF
jgi:hypothetical protein